MRLLPSVLLCLASTFANAIPINPDIDFAGPPPGKAEITKSDAQTIGLQNSVLSASWSFRDGQLRPDSLRNSITGQSYDQSGSEVFRLTTKPTNAENDGALPVEVTLSDDMVIVRIGQDGKGWATLGEFPRADFPGEPKLIRVGKMNLKALAKDSGGEAGVVGEFRIFNLQPAGERDSYSFKVPVNRTSVQEYAWKAGTKVFSARIDKGTDSAMSWSPAVALIWEDGVRFLLVGVRDKRGTYNLTTAKGEQIKSPQLQPFPAGDLAASRFKLTDPPKAAAMTDGQALEAELTSPQGVRVRWRAELRNGANYIRQTIALTSPQQACALQGVEFADLRLPNLTTIGTAPGCPVAGSGFFAGVEMPGATNLTGRTGARIAFACALELNPTQSYTFGSVIGVSGGQLRRSFLRYIERERARQSQPFLHYNCWYDLGYKVDEPQILDVVRAFDTELVKKRGVPVRSYLVDDGWDNPRMGLWIENTKSFPQGFAGTKAKMDPLGAHLGIWISPLGGYGGDKERTAHAQKLGLIPEGAKLDLSYPKYRQWFTDRCLQLMREGGVNSFKWDRAGSGASPHFMALLDVAKRLRVENPEVFINVTAGTWASPFWLNHIDSTWRLNSNDVGWTGKGDDREKWLTFRDGYCHKRFAQASPLYPLNSAMHHGIVHGRAFQGAKVGKAGNDLKNEVRSYFANGTSLQELYLTPSMMTPAAWDHVAASAKWAHAHADVLRDAHWVGGDPLILEPYGYAAWNPQAATLMLRNPDDQPRTIELDADVVFELPNQSRTATPAFDLRSPYADQRLRTLRLVAGTKVTVTLEPFEVLVFDTGAGK